jgi:hypothetical protein
VAAVTQVRILVTAEQIFFSSLVLEVFLLLDRNFTIKNSCIFKCKQILDGYTHCELWRQAARAGRNIFWVLSFANTTKYNVQVLSDLNKHMRTVHHTYRRKAKIPKDIISEMDNPDLGMAPQIYGAKSFKQRQAADTTDGDEMLPATITEEFVSGIVLSRASGQEFSF